MIGVVVSRADPASERIGTALLDRADWLERTDADLAPADGGGSVHTFDHFELRTFDRLHLELAGAADAFSDPSAIVFVSRHAGESGPLLSAHFPGNVADAAYGGSPREVPRPAPAALRHLLGTLTDVAPPGYDVGLECTHHGPSRVGAPCLFAELGSGPDQWTDSAGAAAVARAVLSLPPAGRMTDRVVVGLGGGHYAPRFARLLRETDWCVGHIAADWALAELGTDGARRAVIDQLFERSGATLALIDGECPDLERLVESLGYRVVSETWLREADGVSRGVIEAVEGALGPIDEGTRIGERTDVVPGAIEVTSLPASLVDLVQGIDRESALATVAAETVAYGTTENGNRLTGRLVLAPSSSRRGLISALVPLLRAAYEKVCVEEDEIRLTERIFDPEAARALGVPEGPAFGRLANGDVVEVEEREVRPADVTSREERRIPLQDP